MKRKLFSLLMIGVLIGSIGCAKSKESSIEGTYKQVSEPESKPNYVWTFAEDGSCTIGTEGYYAINKEGDDYYLLLSEERSSLELDYAEYPITYEKYLIRKEEQVGDFSLIMFVNGEANESAAYVVRSKEGTNGLTGTTVFEGSYDRINKENQKLETYEFHNDGTFDIAIEPLTYKIENDELTIKGDGGSNTFGYTRSEDGSSITLEFDEHVQYVLNKIKKS